MDSSCQDKDVEPASSGRRFLLWTATPQGALLLWTIATLIAITAVVLDLL